MHWVELLDLIKKRRKRNKKRLQMKNKATVRLSLNRRKKKKRKKELPHQDWLVQLNNSECHKKSHPLGSH